MMIKMELTEAEYFTLTNGLRLRIDALAPCDARNRYEALLNKAQDALAAATDAEVTAE